MAEREPDNLAEYIRSLDFVKEWGVTGLNRGPADYESDALTDCANAPRCNMRTCQLGKFNKWVD